MAPAELGALADLLWLGFLPPGCRIARNPDKAGARDYNLLLLYPDGDDGFSRPALRSFHEQIGQALAATAPVLILCPDEAGHPPHWPLTCPRLWPWRRLIAASCSSICAWLQRSIVGYGYKPFRSLWWILALWMMAASLGHHAWNAGAMVPNSDVILASREWQEVAALPNAADRWAVRSATGRDWEEFNSLAWGLEVAVPVLRLWQVEAWAPSPSRGFHGRAAWWGRWLISIAGWIVAGLFAAAVTGIIKRE